LLLETRLSLFANIICFYALDDACVIAKE